MAQHTEMYVVGIYLLLLVGVGYAFRRYNSNVDDYFRSGCQGTWWLVGMSMFMAMTGAGTFVAGAGVNYEAGLTAYTYGTIAMLTWVPTAFLAHWFRQLRCITFPEVIRKRFGERTQIFYMCVGLPTGLIGAGIQLWALAIFTSSVFGFHLQATIAVLGAIVLFYSTVGGNWAVMGTDFVQGMIMIPMLFLVSLLCWIEVGGVSGIREGMAELDLAREWAFIKEPGVFEGDKYTAEWLFAMTILLLGQSVSLGTALRFFSVKDGHEAKVSAWFMILLGLMSTVVWCIPSFTARLLYHDQVMATDLSKPAESAYAVASMNVLPSGMVGLMAVAIFAAGMSTLDTGFNRTAAVAVQDIYPILCRAFGWRERHGAFRLALGKVITILCGITILCLALYFSKREGKGMFETMMSLVALLGTPMSIPLVLGLFMRRVPRWSAMIAIVSGLCVSATAFICGRFGHPWDFATTVLSVTSVSVLTFASSRFFYTSAPETYKAQVDIFFTTMRTPVDYQREVGRETDLGQLRVIGLFTMTLGLLVDGLLILQNDLRGVLCVLGVSLFILTVGAGLFLVGWHRGNTREIP